MANAPAAGQALDVLALIARRGEPVPAAAIARDLGLPRSSVYHLLAVLVDRGYVRHLPEERRYGLGLAAYELGSAYQRQAPLERMARGTMDRLVDATGHNAHLAVLHGRDVLYVIEQRAPGRPLLLTDVGVRLPAVLTASGLAMLAALPAAQVRALFPDRGALVQRDGRGPSSTTQLRSQLQAVRQRGHAVEDGLVTPGLGSVAIAVLDHNDYPVAGVAVTYPQADVDERRRGGAGGGGATGRHRPERPDGPGSALTRGPAARSGTRGGDRQTPIRSQRPQMAKVMPRLAWMLTNRVWPSGLKVDPANSSSERSRPGCCEPVEGDVEQLATAWVRPRSSCRWCCPRRAPGCRGGWS